MLGVSSAREPEVLLTVPPQDDRLAWPFKFKFSWAADLIPR